MSRHEPNASHYSARYAERKRAAERTQDAAMGPQPCLRCPETQVPGKLLCATHDAEYAAMLGALKAGGWAQADIDRCLEFTQRTYWPEVSP